MAEVLSDVVIIFIYLSETTKIGMQGYEKYIMVKVLNH